MKLFMTPLAALAALGLAGCGGPAGNDGGGGGGEAQTGDGDKPKNTPAEIPADTPEQREAQLAEVNLQRENDGLEPWTMEHYLEVFVQKKEEEQRQRQAADPGAKPNPAGPGGSPDPNDAGLRNQNDRRRNGDRRGLRNRGSPDRTNNEEGSGGDADKALRDAKARERREKEQREEEARKKERERLAETARRPALIEEMIRKQCLAHSEYQEYMDAGNKSKSEFDRVYNQCMGQEGWRSDAARKEQEIDRRRPKIGEMRLRQCLAGPEYEKYLGVNESGSFHVSESEFDDAYNHCINEDGWHSADRGLEIRQQARQDQEQQERRDKVVILQSSRHLSNDQRRSVREDSANLDEIWQTHVTGERQERQQYTAMVTDIIAKHEEFESLTEDQLGEVNAIRQELPNADLSLQSWPGKFQTLQRYSAAVNSDQRKTPERIQHDEAEAARRQREALLARMQPRRAILNALIYENGVSARAYLGRNPNEVAPPLEDEDGIERAIQRNQVQKNEFDQMKALRELLNRIVRYRINDAAIAHLNIGAITDRNIGAKSSEQVRQDIEYWQQFQEERERQDNEAAAAARAAEIIVAAKVAKVQELVDMYNTDFGKTIFSRRELSGFEFAILILQGSGDVLNLAFSEEVIEQYYNKFIRKDPTSTFRSWKESSDEIVALESKRAAIIIICKADALTPEQSNVMRQYRSKLEELTNGRLQNGPIGELSDESNAVMFQDINRRYMQLIEGPDVVPCTEERDQQNRQRDEECVADEENRKELLRFEREKEGLLKDLKVIVDYNCHVANGQEIPVPLGSTQDAIQALVNTDSNILFKEIVLVRCDGDTDWHSLFMGLFNGWARVNAVKTRGFERLTLRHVLNFSAREIDIDSAIEINKGNIVALSSEAANKRSREQKVEAQKHHDTAVAQGRLGPSEFNILYPNPTIKWGIDDSLTADEIARMTTEAKTKQSYLSKKKYLFELMQKINHLQGSSAAHDTRVLWFYNENLTPEQLDVAIRNEQMLWFGISRQDALWLAVRRHDLSSNDLEKQNLVKVHQSLQAGQCTQKYIDFFLDQYTPQPGQQPEAYYLTNHQQRFIIIGVPHQLQICRHGFPTAEEYAAEQRSLFEMIQKMRAERSKR